MPFVSFGNGLHCFKVCVCKAFKSSAFTSVSVLIYPSILLRLKPSLCVRGAFRSSYARISASTPVSMCVSSPHGGVFWPSQSSGEGGVIFHCDRLWPMQGGPRVSRLIVSGQSRSSSCSSSKLPPTTDHGPCRSQEKWPWQRLLCLFLKQAEEDHTPSWARKRPRQRDRHAKTKFNWFTAYTDQGFAHLFRSMSWFNQRAL